MSGVGLPNQRQLSVSFVGLGRVKTPRREGGVEITSNASTLTGRFVQAGGQSQIQTSPVRGDV